MKVGNVIIYYSPLKRIFSNIKPKKSTIKQIIKLDKINDYIIILANNYVVNGFAKNITWFEEKDKNMQLSIFDL